MVLEILLVLYQLLCSSPLFFRGALCEKAASSGKQGGQPVLVHYMQPTVNLKNRPKTPVHIIDRF